MSTEGMGQYLQATKASAFAQAIELATKSDRLARQDVRSRNRMLVARASPVHVVALWRPLLRLAWTVGVILVAIALGLDLFSD